MCQSVLNLLLLGKNIRETVRDFSRFSKFPDPTLFRKSVHKPERSDRFQSGKILKIIEDVSY